MNIYGDVLAVKRPDKIKQCQRSTGIGEFRFSHLSRPTMAAKKLEKRDKRTCIQHPTQCDLQIDQPPVLGLSASGNLRNTNIRQSIKRWKSWKCWLVSFVGKFSCFSLVLIKISETILNLFIIQHYLSEKLFRIDAVYMWTERWVYQNW